MKTADFLEKRGDIDGALAIYEDILNKNPNNNISIQKIKSLLVKYERFDEGIDFLKSRIMIHPNNYRLYSELGELYFLNNDQQEAEKIWSTSLSKFKNNKSYYRNMISIHGKYGLNEALEIVLNQGRKIFGKAFLSYESGVHFQSLRTYDKAMDQYILYLTNEPKQIGIIEPKIIISM